MESKEKKPKVSVCVITYNQEKYIRQCLQSIVDQETDFDFEVVVGDDCSTDGTRAIVQEFAEKYPKIIRTIYQEKNTGGSKNNLDVHEAAIGKYIAHVDGDDYALPGKLQAQSDYLDAHSECNIVWHRVKILDVGKEVFIDDYNAKTKTENLKFSRKDILLIGAVGCHSSKMYRKQVEKNEIHHGDVMDFYMDVKHVGVGYAYILNECYGVYRKNIGLTSGLATKIKYLSHLNEFIAKYPEHRAEIAANAFLNFLLDIKNGRSTWRDALKVWAKVNPILMILKFRRSYFYLKLFKSDKF